MGGGNLASDKETVFDDRWPRRIGANWVAPRDRGRLRGRRVRELGPKGSHEATRRNRNPASSDGYAVASPETGKGTASGRRRSGGRVRELENRKRGRKRGGCP